MADINCLVLQAKPPFSMSTPPATSSTTSQPHLHDATSPHSYDDPPFFLFNSNSEPTVFENYVHDLYVDEQLVELSLWDTAGSLLFLLYGCASLSHSRHVMHKPYDLSNLPSSTLKHPNPRTS
jgi:hypothetical protein